MKIFVLNALCFLAAAVLAPLAYAAPAVHDKDIGLGIVVGEPTGFTGKVFSNDRHNAIDATVSYSFGDFLVVTGDYLWHRPGMFAGKSHAQFVRELSPYVGVGGAFLFAQDGARNDGNLYTDNSSSNFGAALRVPVGVEWLAATAPIGVFAELVPGVGVIPAAFFMFQLGVGARFYF